MNCYNNPNYNERVLLHIQRLYNNTIFYIFQFGYMKPNLINDNIYEGLFKITKIHKNTTIWLGYYLINISLSLFNK